MYMTQLLQTAFEEVTKLPELEQNRLARWLLEELASEKQWDTWFAESEDQFSQLAEEALAEHRAGKTQLLVSET
jgi:hypothetical protein